VQSGGRSSIVNDVDVSVDATLYLHSFFQQFSCVLAELHDSCVDAVSQKLATMHIGRHACHDIVARVRAGRVTRFYCVCNGVLTFRPTIHSCEFWPHRSGLLFLFPLLDAPRQ